MHRTNSVFGPSRGLCSCSPGLLPPEPSLVPRLRFGCASAAQKPQHPQGGALPKAALQLLGKMRDYPCPGGCEGHRVPKGPWHFSFLEMFTFIRAWSCFQGGNLCRRSPLEWFIRLKDLSKCSLGAALCPFSLVCPHADERPLVWNHFTEKHLFPPKGPGFLLPYVLLGCGRAARGSCPSLSGASQGPELLTPNFQGQAAGLGLQTATLGSYFLFR